MRRPGKRQTMRIAAWLVFSVIVALTRGFGIHTAAWAVVLLPLLAAPEKADPGPVSVILLGIAAVTPADGLFVALVIASGLLVAWQASSILWKASGAVSAALCGGILLFGSQTPASSLIPFAQEIHHSDVTVWDNVGSLDGASPSVLFRTGGRGIFLISVDAGGVRDADPTGVIRTGTTEIPIHSGHSTHEIDLGQMDSAVVVEMTRPWEPFNHPVIHFTEVVFSASETQ